MATIASALVQSIAGLYRSPGEPVPVPASLRLAPMTEVPSPVGAFQTLVNPTFYDPRNPMAVGPSAAHPNGQFGVSTVTYNIGDPRLAPYFAISDREANALTSANPALDIVGQFNRGNTEWLHTDHLLQTITAVNAAGLTDLTTIDLNAKSTNILAIFQAAARAIFVVRRARPNVFICARAVAEVLDQFDQVADFRGFAAATASGVGTFTAGTNPVGAFGRWLQSNLGIELVIDESVALAIATGTPGWALSGTYGYLAVAQGGSAPSAFKTLYVPFSDASIPAPTDTEAHSGEGLFRFSVRRAAPPAQAGWVASADAQFATVTFDGPLARRAVFSNAPTL